MEFRDFQVDFIPYFQS